MTWQDMAGTVSEPVLLLEIVALHFILPALLTWAIASGMRKAGWIKFGDMTLPDLRK